MATAQRDDHGVPRRRSRQRLSGGADARVAGHVSSELSPRSAPQHQWEGSQDMAEHIKWTDREFQFNFPAGVYPELIERLRGTPARLAERLAVVPAGHRVQRHGGNWS